LFGNELPDSLPVITTTSAATTLPSLPNSGATTQLTYPTPAPTNLCIRDINIERYIDFKVTTAGEHLSKWRQVFTFLLSMHNCLDHVMDGAAPAAPSADWMADDIHISLCFMKTLADDLHRLVAGSDGRAATTWSRLHNFFFANRSSRYVYLSKIFRNTPRGDMRIATYADRLQTIADDLADIGYPVADHDLTMQFLAGLGRKFRNQSEMIQGTPPLPSFTDACSRLLLAEHNYDHEQ
jgi:hypothetical protein